MNISRISTINTNYKGFSKNKFSGVSVTSNQLDKMMKSQKFDTSKVRASGMCDDDNPYITHNHAGEWC